MNAIKAMFAFLSDTFQVYYDLWENRTTYLAELQVQLLPFISLLKREKSLLDLAPYFNQVVGEDCVNSADDNAWKHAFLPPGALGVVGNLVGLMEKDLRNDVPEDADKIPGWCNLAA
jgi:hypothetical protein